MSLEDDLRAAEARAAHEERAASEAQEQRGRELSSLFQEFLSLASARGIPSVPVWTVHEDYDSRRDIASTTRKFQQDLGEGWWIIHRPFRPPTPERRYSESAVNYTLTAGGLLIPRGHDTYTELTNRYPGPLRKRLKSHLRANAGRTMLSPLVTAVASRTDNKRKSTFAEKSWAIDLRSVEHGSIEQWRHALAEYLRTGQPQPLF